MKNEEWELHFLLGKMGRGKNRADAMDEMVERRYGRSWLYFFDL